MKVPVAKRLIIALIMITNAAGLLWSAETAGPNILGSPGYMPSPEQPYGWRGDGSGRYPGATPPVQFGRLAITPLNALKCQAKKPAPDVASGTSLSEYAGEFRITEWLVLGPIDPPDATHPLNGEPIPNETALAPDEGDAAGTLKWKRVEGMAGVDFGTVFGVKPAGKIAYAVAYVHSDEAFKCAMFWHGRDMKQWLNGAPASGWERAKQSIKKGWNQIVVKMAAPANQDGWTFSMSLFPHSEEGLTYRETNIRWSRPLPASSWSMPVLAGNKIFVTSDPSDLICLDKQDGKMLWVQSNPVWYAALEDQLNAKVTLEFVRHTKSDVVLQCNQRLEKESAINPETYSIAGVKINKAELSPDGCTIRLTASAPWPWRDWTPVTLKLAGLKTEKGVVITPDPNFSSQAKMLALEAESGPLADEPAAPNYVEELRPKIVELEHLNDALVKGTAPANDEPRRKLSQGITDAVRKSERAYRVSIGWGGGNTGPTPVTDGKNIWAWFGETGVLACFDLDGKRIWTRYEKPGGGEHGINSSPALSGQTIVLIAGGHWAALDKTSGKLLWRQKYSHPCYGSPVVANIGQTPVVVAPDGMVLRVSDGEIVSPGVGQFDGECASAIVEGNRFSLFARQGFCVAELPAAAEKNAGVKIILKMDPKVLDPGKEPYPVGTPVYHDGLIYGVRSGWGAGSRDVILYAFDPLLPEPVYRQKLDMEPMLFYGPEGGGVCASLAFAGGNIYVLDNRGTNIVFAPGREYKQLARNRLDHWMRSGYKEVTGSTPIFEGKFMYVRGREMLYCIGEP